MNTVFNQLLAEKSEMYNEVQYIDIYIYLRGVIHALF